MAIGTTYSITVLLDVNEIQDVDDRAESRSYIVADRESKQAAIIDAVIENVERDLRLINELGLTLCFAIETHIHADHITGASAITDRSGAQIVYGGGAKGEVTGADLFLFEGEALRLGQTSLTALATPGHTNGCTSYMLPGAVFTGGYRHVVCACGQGNRTQRGERLRQAHRHLARRFAVRRRPVLPALLRR